MHTQTAVVATRIKEVAAVVERFEIGVIVDPFSTEQLALEINALLNDPKRLARYKENCIPAAQRENWEKETEVLAEIYPHV